MLSIFKSNFNLRLINNFTSILRKPIYDREVFVSRPNWLKRHCYVEFCKVQFCLDETILVKVFRRYLSLFVCFLDLLHTENVKILDPFNLLSLGLIVYLK